MTARPSPSGDAAARRDYMVRSAMAALAPYGFGRNVQPEAEAAVDALLAAEEKGENGEGQGSGPSPDGGLPGNMGKESARSDDPALTRSTAEAVIHGPSLPSPDHAAQIAAAEREVIERAMAVQDSDLYQTGQDGERTAVRDEVLQPLLDARDALRRLREEVGG